MRRRLGNVDDKEMFRTFNMGIGMIVVVAEGETEAVKTHFYECHEIGKVVDGNGDVVIN